MATKIHPTAIVDPKAVLGEDVVIGPNALIEAGARIGDRCIIGPMVHIQGLTEIGPENEFYTGAAIGFPAQVAGVKPVPMRTVIGARNVFREFVTVHASMKPEGETIIGDDCFLMVNAHIAHDCHVGDRVIMANGAMLAGHVSVGDRAFISGNAAVHQFCRVGRLVMLAGLARVTNDIPPFVVCEGSPAKLRGLNAIGLRRAGIDSAGRMELKRLLRALYQSERTFTQSLNEINPEKYGPECREYIEFCKNSKRGMTGYSLAGRRGAGESEEE